MIVLSYHIRVEPPGTAPPLKNERNTVQIHMIRRMIK